jgi:SAM-dependent methyltransferase
MHDGRGGADYIHGTAPREQGRLAALNRLTNRVFVEFLSITPGMRVLEVGSGLGLLAAEVGAAARGVHVTGLEKSSEQIAAAVPSEAVTYLKGDARQLDLPDRQFDLVYARFLLEHVSEPERVLREMRRVVRPGGRVVVCENDISLIRWDPPCPTFEEVWLAFQRHQRELGGDGLVGRRLYRLFRGAGLRQIELSVQPEVHWHGSAGFEGWLQNQIGNLEGAREGLVESGWCGPLDLEKAIAELEQLRHERDASSCFCWNRASAIR